MTRVLWSGLLALTAAFWGTAAFGAEAPAVAAKPAKTHAVLVGVGEKFTDPQIKPRPTAEADAKALYDIFSDKAYVTGGSAQLLLGNPGPDHPAVKATQENITKALHEAVAKAGKDDLIVIALIGQGASVGERTCYFAADSTFKDREKNALTTAAIEHELGALKGKGVRVVAFVDINFKGYDAGKESVPEPRLFDIVRVFLGLADKEDSEDEAALPPGRAVFLASRRAGESLILEKQGHGLFAQVVAAGLKGGADQEGFRTGYEADGLVTVDELKTYLEKEVPKLAREAGQKIDERELPSIVSAPNCHYAITHTPDLAAKTAQRLEQLGKLAAGKQVSSEIDAEGHKLLAQMPRLKGQQELRKLYEQLVDGSLTVEKFLAAREKVKAGQRISDEQATAYAEKVMNVVSMLRREYVKELNPGEMVGWAVKGLYTRLEEPIPADVKAQLDGAKALSRGKLADLLVDVRQRLGQREDLADNKDVDLTLQAVMTRKHLDPYTNYIDKEQVRRFKMETRNEFVGVGIQIRQDLAHDALLVVTPIKGSPAYKKGVKAGDLILEIIRPVDETGKELATPEHITTKGLETEDAVKKILGKEGTPVILKVKREGWDEPKDVEIVRGKVETETVLGYKRKSDDSWDFWVDPESKIGYIRLTQFGPRSAEQMETAVKKLSEEGVKGVVLDLRGNPGGMLGSAVEISDLFIDDGLIVAIRPRNLPEQRYGGKHEGSYLNFPLVCMVNDGSASGSEIVSAALQDHKRAIILGERSYGKGSVQTISEFPSTGAAVKITTASFWRPNGKNLNKSSTKGGEDEDWGVRPDPGYEVKLTPKERLDLELHLRDLEIIPRRDLPTKLEDHEHKDKQLDKALEYLKSQIKMAGAAPINKAG
jgi:C-terminal peptidase prc